MWVLRGYFLNWTPTVDWFVVQWGSKRKHHKDTCLKEIKLHRQTLTTTLHSTVHIIGEDLCIQLRINKHALPIPMTQTGEARFSIWFLHMLLRSRFAHATRVLFVESNRWKLENMEKEPNNTPCTLSSIIKGSSRQPWCYNLSGIVEKLQTNILSDGVKGFCWGWCIYVRESKSRSPRIISHLRPNSRDLGFGCLIFLAVAFGFTWGSTWQSILSIFGQCPHWLYNINGTLHTTYVQGCLLCHDGG